MKINTLDDLKFLLENNIPESNTLDYKRDLEYKGEATKDLLRDICSFANTNGGFLVFGVDEKRIGKEKQGTPGEIFDIKQHHPNLESLKFDLHNTITSGITPDVSINIETFTLEENKTVLVITINPSNNKPFVLKKDLNIFIPRREQFSKKYFDYQGIQSLFTQKEAIMNNYKKTLESRIPTLDLQNYASYFHPLLPIEFQHNQSYIMIHAFPNNQVAINIKDYKFNNSKLFATPVDNRPSYNSDGTILKNNEHSYRQIFREGNIESLKEIQNQGVKLNILLIQDWITEEIKNILGDATLCTDYESVSDFIIFVSLVDIQNKQIVIGSHEYLGTPKRKNATAPNISIIKENKDYATLKTELVPVFDFIWQCFGEKECTVLRDYP